MNDKKYSNTQKAEVLQQLNELLDDLTENATCYGWEDLRTRVAAAKVHVSATLLNQSVQTEGGEHDGSDQ